MHQFNQFSSFLWLQCTISKICYYLASLLFIHNISSTAVALHFHAWIIISSELYFYDTSLQSHKTFQKDWEFRTRERSGHDNSLVRSLCFNCLRSASLMLPKSQLRVATCCSEDKDGKEEARQERQRCDTDVFCGPRRSNVPRCRNEDYARWRQNRREKEIEREREARPRTSQEHTRLYIMTCFVCYAAEKTCLINDFIYPYYSLSISHLEKGCFQARGVSLIRNAFHYIRERYIPLCE